MKLGEGKQASSARTHRPCPTVMNKRKVSLTPTELKEADMPIYTIFEDEVKIVLGIDGNNVNIAADSYTNLLVKAFWFHKVQFCYWIFAKGK